MAEAGHVRVGVVGPRPLGLVKRETIHFEDNENQMEELHASRGPGSTSSFRLGGGNRIQDGLQSRGRSRGGGSQQRSELRSMRNLQETLRQAALLNIVAAVNHDAPPPPSEQSTRISGSQTVGIKGANLLGHTVPGGGGKKLVLIHGQGYGDYTSGSFSRHLHGGVAMAPVHGAPPAPPNTASNPNSTLSTLLSHRSRTISIPRPRTQSEQSSFMHNSLNDAKEQLVNMTNFRARSNFDSEGFPVITSDTATLDEPKQATGTTKQEQGQAKKSQDGYKVTMNSGDSPYALHGVSMDATTNGEGVGQLGGDIKTGGKGPQTPLRSKEDKRAHTVQQMQSLKKHISTSKKKELMMKLTELAKCEAVDISEPVRNGIDKAPPSIIILAQKKDASMNGPNPPEILTTPLNGGRPVTDAQALAPVNTRIHSETADAIAAYRQSKGLDTFEVGDDLRIESISGNHVADQNLEIGHKRDGRKNGLDGYQNNVIDLNMWVREHLFSDSIVGKTMQSPELMELRPVDANTPSPVERGFISDRRRFMASKRLPVYSVREKLYSPSPVVYEATYHRPKASTGDISLVGQSLPSLSSVKPPLQTSKPSSKRVSSANTRAPSQEDQQTEHDETHLKHLAELPDRKQNLTFCKPWGSTSKQPSTASPILRTEILDHLQCVGIIDRRPPNMSQKKSISKISGINKIGLETEDVLNGEFYDEEFDHCSDTGVRATRPEYRKSKLYSAFRASEENLATMADNASLVSENLTTKSLLNQPVTGLLEKNATASLQNKEAEKTVVKEPLYMGCSSMVSENDIRSQFHYVNGEDNSLAQKGTNFKVLKALDQDVYFDFQHRKYRSGNSTNNTTSLNTGANKPRMHFLKIKFPGES